MKKTFVLVAGSGGGVWGYSQILNALAIETASGVRINQIADFYHAGSVGNILCAAAALDNTDTTKPSIFETTRDNFIPCASSMLNGEIRQKQLSRAVSHDLHHLACRPLSSGFARAAVGTVLKDSTGKIHLDHSILHRYLTTTFGDISLQSLKKPYFSYAKRMEQRERICFANFNGIDPLFDTTKWAVNPNMARPDTKLSDVIMASTAVSTVFPAYKIDGVDYIDCASFLSPKQTIKNIFRMAGEYASDIRIELIYFGTGNMAEVAWKSGQYNNHGPLQMMSDLIHGMSMGVVEEEFRELMVDHGKQVNIHMIDTPVPTTIEGKDFAYDAFDFSPKSQSMMENLVELNLAKNLENYSRAFNSIAETKAKESMVEPLAAFIPPSRQKERWLSRLMAPLTTLRGTTQVTVHSPQVR